MTSRCRSCDASIRWVRTASGRAMPIDAEPSREGNIRLGFIGGIECAIVLTDPAERAAAQIAGDVFVSHFATCPNAAQHRQPRVVVDKVSTNGSRPAA